MARSNGRPLALVTGASSGIGMELAREFARQGFDLVIAAENADIELAGTELRGEGSDVTAVQVDLATYEGVEELVSAAGAAGRPLDAVAINAGVGVGGPFAESDL